MELNNENKESVAPDYALHSIRGIIWATMIGSFLAGGVVMAINYGRLGRTASQRKAVIWSLLSAMAVFSLLTLVPVDSNIPGLSVVPIQVIVMYSLAMSFQCDLIRSHRERGGAVVPVWRGAGVGVLCAMVVYSSLFIAYFTMTPSEYGDVVMINENDKVYYVDEATKEDAQFLGEMLTKEGFFGHGSGASVQIKASSNLYTIKFPITEGAWNNSEFIEYMKEFGRVLSDERFGRPLKICLCDGVLRVRKQIDIE